MTAEDWFAGFRFKVGDLVALAPAAAMTETRIAGALMVIGRTVTEESNGSYTRWYEVISGIDGKRLTFEDFAVCAYAPPKPQDTADELRKSVDKLLQE